MSTVRVMTYVCSVRSADGLSSLPTSILCSRPGSNPSASRSISKIGANGSCWCVLSCAVGGNCAVSGHTEYPPSSEGSKECCSCGTKVDVRKSGALRVGVTSCSVGYGSLNCDRCWTGPGMDPYDSCVITWLAGWCGGEDPLLE